MKLNPYNSKRIPMEERFMKKKVNDILYGYLQSVSHFDGQTTFVYKDRVNFSEMETIFRGQFNRLKLSRDFKFLLSIGLIEEGEIKTIRGEMVNVYILPFNEKELYRIIPLDTLRFLIDTTNSNVIKIYVYLLYKYNFGKCKGYEFTQKELLEALKIKSHHERDRNMIKNILICLKNNGLIKYDEKWKFNEKSSIGSTKYNILENVSLYHKK